MTLYILNDLKFGKHWTNAKESKYSPQPSWLLILRQRTTWITLHTCFFLQGDRPFSQNNNNKTNIQTKKKNRTKLTPISHKTHIYKNLNPLLGTYHYWASPNFREAAYVISVGNLWTLEAEKITLWLFFISNELLAFGGE